MNALVGVRSNVAGLLNPSPEKRAEAAKQIMTNVRATMLGKVTDPQTLAKAQEAEATGETEAPQQTSQTSSTGRVVNNELDRDAFLRLLVLQMQNQDPLEPVENSEMIAQLAQFSSLEQMEKLNSNFEDLSGNIDQLNFINANSMIGRNVTGVTEDGTVIEGEVESVQLEGSLVHLVVDGQLLSMAGVISITDGSK